MARRFSAGHTTVFREIRCRLSPVPFELHDGILRSSSDMLPEYDFSGAVRGKYTERFREGGNLVLLDPDVAAAFPDSAAVNSALRLLADVAERQSRATSKRRMAKAKTAAPGTSASGSRRRRAARS